MKLRSESRLPPFIHPESLRQPLLDALSDFFIPCWPDPDQPVDSFCESLARAVDLLMRGLSRVPLDAAPVALIEAVRARARRSAERTTAGTKVAPERGYSLRMAVTGDRVGLILQIDTTGGREPGAALAFIKIAAVFSPEDFKVASRAVRAYELKLDGLSDAVVRELAPKALEADMTLDYDLEFNPGAPAPKF